MLNIAIVGGGPTALYALQALVDGKTPFAAAIFECSEILGRGTPYDPELNNQSLLANIASFELPPVGEPFADWLRGLPAAARRRYGVAEGAISDRGFYPRVVLGAYFATAFRALVVRAEAAGNPMTLHRGVRVVDVEGAAEGAKVVYRARGGALQNASFDYVIIATGHRSGARKRNALTAPAYPTPEAPPERPLHAAILGASLTAIDVAVSLALQRGEFFAGEEGLSYRLKPGAAPLHLEMLSRRGVLPEADYYFPYPYQPLRFCHAQALKALRGSEPARRLDLAFDLLRRELLADAPEFSEKIGLPRLTADTFADAYFAVRGGGGDPFVKARRNLGQAREGVERRRASPWRYALLRAHEAFGELAPYLGEADAARFRGGLQRVFVDNYAAVPPVSVERVLALRAAGVLSLRKLAPGYLLRRGESGGIEIAEGATATHYDLAVEARGERPAAAREIPFPTLRLQILANQRMRSAVDDPQAEVDEHLRFARGVNPVDRIYCLAAPFLLGRRPFVQGLTSAQELAARAVAHMLSRDGEINEIELDRFSATESIYLRPGLLISTPIRAGKDSAAEECAADRERFAPSAGSL